MADPATPPRSCNRVLAADQPSAYDAAFAEDDANIVLTSSDSVYYRVHAFTLRTTSGFFRDMISLHQYNTAESCEDTIALDEPSNVLGALLRLISGFGVMKWESYDDVENVLAAAQKYDMTGPLMMIRAAITSPIFMEQPLRLYAIAARYGWEDEAKLASKHSLILSIHDDEHAAILERIPTPYVLRLFRLHRVRRDEFKKHVTRDHGCFGIQHCPYCGESFQKSPVAVLMNLIIWEMDRRPAGDGLLDGQWKEWPMCKGCRCMQSCTTRYQGDLIADDIRTCLRSLPSTI